MAAPTANDLRNFLNRNVPTEQAEQALRVVTSMAEGYTRGEGFSDHVPNAEIEAVIISAAARMVTNPSTLDRSESVGPQSASIRGGFTGWNVAEAMTLTRYKVTAL